MKKILTILFATFIPISSVFSFTDINYSQNKEAIEYVQNIGAVQGYSDNTFRPLNSVNRAEFVKILIEAKFPSVATTQNQTNCFPDVKNEWFAPYICYAKTNGIITGYPDSYFKPANQINLAEALKVVLKTYDVEIDNAQYTNWYGGYFAKAQENKWLEKINANVTHYLSRGEMAQFIYAINTSTSQNGSTKTNTQSQLNTNTLNGSTKRGQTCHENSFNMAMILLVQNQADATNQITQVLSSIMLSFENSFKSATQNLAEMHTEGPFVIQITDDMIDNFGLLNIKLLTKEFYKNYPDEYEFISIYPTFNTNEIIPLAGAATHTPVQNKINGIGMNVFDDTASYGSSGALLGINMMTNIKGTLQDSISTSNILLHETAHQWCCYTGDSFANGENQAQLEITNGTGHYHRGLHSPSSTGSPLNSDHWVSNGNGTYMRTFNYDDSFKYHPFTLYFMGLLSESEYDKDYPIYDSGLQPNFNFVSAPFYKNVNIRDIIKVEGERSCSN